MAERFDIGEFARGARLVARVASADEVFSFLNRAVTVPVGCAALVWEGGGPPRLASAGAEIESEGVSRVLFVRTLSFLLGYRFDGLTSRDGYAASARLEAPVRVAGERADLAAFCDRVAGSRPEVTVEELGRYCEAPMRAAAAAHAMAHDAADLLVPEAAGRFNEVLAEHFRPLGFSSGLLAAGEARITFESSDFARAAEARKSTQAREARVEEERRLRSLAAEARAAHLTELEAALGRLRELTAKHGGTPLAELIRAMEPVQRGGLYQALLARKGERKAERLVVVAGQDVLWIDPASPREAVRRLNLSSDAGPLRSVRAARWEGRPVVLIGARNGVHLLETEQDPRRSYGFRVERALRGGVNAATIVGERLYGTHSEAGLISWALRRGGEAEFLLSETLSGAKSVRDAHADEGGRLWLAADDRVIVVSTGADGAVDSAAEPIVLPAGGEVSALAVADGGAYAGLGNGAIVHWPAADAKARDVIRAGTGDRVTSLAWLPGGGVPRLLAADRRPYVEMMVIGDVSSAKYAARHAVVRAGASEGWVFGVNERRDQVMLWRVEDPAEEAGVIAVGRMCGESVQDVAIVTN